MTQRAPDYSREDVVAALRAVGVRKGDVLFSHASVGMLGLPAEGLNKDALVEMFSSAFREVLGPDGLWILPTYSYSYTKGEAFDPASTPPGNMGLLAEALWDHPDAVRSLDPIFSVVGFGPRAPEIVGGAGAEDCFGPASIYARLIDLDGAICNIGIGIHAALIHHVEQKLEVSYRYIKRFSGTTVVAGEERSTEVAYNVRSLESDRHVPYFMRLDKDARTSGAAGVARVGRGEINLIRARAMENLIREGLQRDPEYLVLGDLAGRAIG